MKLLLDSDMLLDIALDREYFAESKRVTDWCQAKTETALVAWHTISNLYYILRSGRSDEKARSFIASLLRFAKVTGAGTAALRQALILPIRDFEDALQVVAGLSVGAQFIITRNVRDYRGAPIPAITPADFARRFIAT